MYVYIFAEQTEYFNYPCSPLDTNQINIKIPSEQIVKTQSTGKVTRCGSWRF